jgi:hypothetical protein
MDPILLTLYGDVQLWLSDIQLHQNDLRAARVPISRLAERITVGPPTGADFSADIKYTLSKLWLAVRLWQARVGLRQARFRHAISIATEGMVDAQSIASSRFQRDFLEVRAAAQYKSGNFDDAELDYQAALENYSLVSMHNVNYVSCCIDFTNVLRERSAKLKTRTEAVAMTKRCVELARATNVVAERLARAHGFYGVNVNAIFEKRDSAVSDFSLMAPYMHNLTVVHGNEPPLFTDIAVTFDTQHVDARSKWRAPKDTKDTHPDSGFLNIYSAQVRVLAVAQASLCIMLDELRLTGLFNSAALLREEFVYAECGLKVVRNCVYLTPAVRITLLLLLGRCMADISRIDGTFTLDEVVAPLLAGLKIGMTSLHPYETMTKLLLQLVDCYGDGKFKSGGATDDNLKLAIGYMCSALKLGSQRDALKTQYMKDDSFDKPVPDSLAGLLKAYAYSSGVAPAVLGAPVAEVVDPKGGKGKGKGAPAAGSDGPGGATGRDVVMLMSSLLRESNPLSLTDLSYSLRADLHCGLKGSFPKYASDMMSSDVLDSEVPTVVAAGSVSTLWVPAKTPDFDPDAPAGDPEGVYVGFDGYMILGSVDPDAGEESQAAITKVLVPLKEVVAIERRLKELAWNLKIATEKKAKMENRLVAAGFATVLDEIAVAFVPSLKGEVTCETAIDEETQNISAAFKLGDETVTLAGDMNTIVALASIFSQDSSTYQHVHADVCRFLRSILGFGL